MSSNSNGVPIGAFPDVGALALSTGERRKQWLELGRQLRGSVNRDACLGRGARRAGRPKAIEEIAYSRHRLTNASPKEHCAAFQRAAPTTR